MQWYSTSINMGSYMINNTMVNLLLRVDITNDQIYLIIPLPDKYPQTQLKIRKIKDEGLFTASLSIISSDSWLEHLQYARRILGPQYANGIALHGFYVIPRLYNVPTTSEEDIMLSGLGKRSICAAVPFIIEKLKLNPSNTLILLEASGGEVTTAEDRMRANNYVSMERNDLTQLFQSKYPEAFNYEYEDLMKYSNMNLAKYLVETENNQGLINYYINTYGFTPLTFPSAYTLMGTLLSTFVGHCQH